MLLVSATKQIDNVSVGRVRGKRKKCCHLFIEHFNAHSRTSTKPVGGVNVNYFRNNIKCACYDSTQRVMRSPAAMHFRELPLLTGNSGWNYVH